jgi:SAM-dependent methyltransferase
MDARTERVRSFYARAPFPGYAPGDTLQALRARGDRRAFARLLDRSIPRDARILDAGCGTGQMCLYLARGGRSVVGLDMTRASLRIAAEAARGFRVDSVCFVEGDLRRPPFCPGAFDVVYSSGVLHHTPNPAASFAQLATLARPGGHVIVGVYNAFARIPVRVRRVIARITAYRVIPFDPVLRDRSTHRERREAWLRDQYQHPEEHRHTLGEVQRWFAENGVRYLRSYPSAVFGDEPDQLFTAAEDNWPPENWLTQLGWMRSLADDGGLFFTIGRRVA